MYSAYSKDPVVNGGLGVRKRFKGLVSRRARRERQKTAYRRQKSEGKRQRTEVRRHKSEVRRQEKVGGLEGWLNIYPSTPPNI